MWDCYQILHRNRWWSMEFSFSKFIRNMIMNDRRIFHAIRHRFTLGYLCDCLSGRVQRYQVVKVIFHKSHRRRRQMVQISSMLFDRWRQRLLPWGHIGATWRIRSNMCILRPTRVHNRNGKWIGSAAFAQLTSVSANTLRWVPLSTRIAPSHGGSGPSM